MNVRVLLVAVCVVVLLATPVPSQQMTKPAMRCLKSTGLDRADEDPAKFWGCMVGVRESTVQVWITKAGFEDTPGDFLDDVRLIRIDKQELALLRHSRGTASCYRLFLLRKSGIDWKPVWQGPDDLCCGNLGCELSVNSTTTAFSIRYRVCTVPEGTLTPADCQHWETRQLNWNGKTLRRSGR